MCLSNVIGIRSDCDTTTPISGLYINGLEGMSLRFADATINSEYKSGVDLIEKKISMAEAQIKNEIDSHFADKVRFDSLIDHDNIGQFEEDLESKSAETGFYKGIKVELDKSGYTKLYISSVKLFLKSAVALDVKIWNVITGKEIASKSVASVADDITEVRFDQEISTDNQETIIFIGYDSTVASNKTTLYKEGYKCRDDCYRNEGLSAFTKKVDKNKTIISENMESTQDTGGLSVEYSIYCSLDNFVCKHATKLALPLMYKVGEMIAREAMYSDRMNSYVLLDDNEGLAEFYADQYKKAMKQITGKMQVPNDVCFKCRPAVRKTIEIP